MPAALVVGGSGYLGQFLIRAFLERGWRTHYTFRSAGALPGCDDAVGHEVDASDASAMDACVAAVFADPAFSGPEDDPRLDLVVTDTEHGAALKKKKPDPLKESPVHVLPGLPDSKHSLAPASLLQSNSKDFASERATS